MLIDTHIWVWWVSGDDRLDSRHRAILAEAEKTGIEVSVISCWEVAKLVENERLVLTMPVLEWLTAALSAPGIRLMPLSPEIVVDSTQLPGTFHKDPVDQMIVATARVTGVPLMTMDRQIRMYPHVEVVTT